jgi:hypothetical protein
VSWLTWLQCAGSGEPRQLQDLMCPTAGQCQDGRFYRCRCQKQGGDNMHGPGSAAGQWCLTALACVQAQACAWQQEASTQVESAAEQSNGHTELSMHVLHSGDAHMH